MTIDEIIANVDEIKPNVYTDEDKTKWISDLDGKLCREVMHRDSVAGYEYPRDADTQALVGAPYDDIYTFYLMAMIDFCNKDYGMYMNTMEMFNNAFDIFAKQYIRNNMPPNSGGFKNYM